MIRINRKKPGKERTRKFWKLKSQFVTNVVEPTIIRVVDRTHVKEAEAKEIVRSEESAVNVRIVPIAHHVKTVRHVKIVRRVKIAPIAHRVKIVRRALRVKIAATVSIGKIVRHVKTVRHAVRVKIAETASIVEIVRHAISPTDPSTPVRPELHHAGLAPRLSCRRSTISTTSQACRSRSSIDCVIQADCGRIGHRLNGSLVLCA
jgi:hypothetical protein